MTGGEATDATDAPSVIVRGDTLGRDWESTFPTVKASAGQVVVSWDKQITEDATESVVGYEVQISSSMYGPWTGAATGCAKSETKSSTRQTCTATGLADGTYFFNVAAVRKPVIKKDKTGNFSQGTRTGNFSAGSPPAIVLSPPGIPATPTVVVGNATFIVTVAAGTATDGTLGGVPASYTVTPTPATTPPMTCTVTGASGNCSITGVTAGAAYTFTATATNAAVPTSGASAKSSTAQWGHMVAFDSNGNGGAGKASQFATSASALRMNTFNNPSGRHFSGWATTSTGPVEYVNGAPYEFTADAYLYAVWGCNANLAHWYLMDAKRTSEHNAELTFRVASTNVDLHWTSFTGSTEGGDHATTVPGGNEPDVVDRTMTITGLNRDSQYNFTVTAQNNIGCNYTSPSDHTGNWGGNAN